MLRRNHDEAQRHAGTRAWTPPRILPWSTWLKSLWFDAVVEERLPAATLLNREQSEALWRALIEQSPDSGNILNLTSTATSALAAWMLLHQYQINWKQLHYPAHEDFTAFALWARAYEQRCAARSWVDDARLPTLITDAICRGAIPVPAQLSLAGFDEFTPQQQALLDALAAAGCCQETVPRKQHSSTPVRVAALHAEAEMRAAARWCRHWLDADPESSIAVVMAGSPDRNLVERVFTEVLHPDWIPSFSQGRASFHISFPRALTSWPIIHSAFLLLKLTQPRLSIMHASAILRSPYLANAQTEAGERALADARLRRGRPAEVTTASIDVWGLSRVRLPEEQTASAWSVTISELLTLAGWASGLSLSSPEYQARLAWESLLARFAALDLVGVPMAFDSAISRLRELATQTSFEPEDENAPVQITGALEAAGAGFDHMWIAGLDADSWPAAAHPHPFLPPALQLQYSLPHCSSEREAAFARRTTARLFETAPDIVVSHPQRHGERVLHPSILIAGIPSRAVPEGPDPYAGWIQKRAVLEIVPDHMAPALTAAETSGGTRVLKAQALCAFRAFAEVRLNARPLEEGTLGVDPLQRGNALHKALELFWNELRSHARLAAMPEEELNELIRRVAEQAVGEGGRPAGPLDTRFQQLEVERVEQVLAGWLALERERIPFEVVFSERERVIPLGGLELKTRIDRVDRLADGELIVVDYKGGNNPPRLLDWEGDRPGEPQVPLYAMSLDEPVAAVAFGVLTPGNFQFRGLARADVLPKVKALKPPDSLEGRITGWRRVLTQLAVNFREGHAEVDPKPTACRYCCLTPLCRISEHRSLTGVEESGDA